MEEKVKKYYKKLKINYLARYISLEINYLGVIINYRLIV